MTRNSCWLFAMLAIALLCTGDVFGRGGFGGGGRGFGGGGGRDFGGGGRDFGGGGFDRGGGNFDRGGGGFDRGGGGFDRGDFGGDRNFGDYGNRGGDFGADRFGGYGNDRYGNFGGDRGNIGDRGWQSAFNGTRFANEGNLGRFSSFNENHGTRNWTQGDIANRANAVRNDFPYHNCFNHGWYANHPGCWFAAGWAAGAAWTWATWPVLTGWCGFVGAPAYYDYGSNIVYQDDYVYYDGNPVCTSQQYAQQATTLADQGQQAECAGQ